VTLQDLLASRANWADTATIYAVEPWSASTEAVLIDPGPDTTEAIVRDGRTFSYMLEGFVVRDLLEDLGAPDGKPSAEICDRLIDYALNDA
jgi:hypothetical protein